MILPKSHIKVDTKKKVLKLIYDPVCLLRLLYSKYGDVEEDYNCLHINQILYETSSHYAIIYKEFEFFQNFDEYLKRWYIMPESVNRMPKINDYYKNYHKFFVSQVLVISLWQILCKIMAMKKPNYITKIIWYVEFG